MSNADKAIPEIEIDLPWGRQKLLFSIAAFCKLEELTGTNALDGQTWAKPNIRILSAILWAGLVDKNGMTLDEMRNKLGLKQLMGLYGEISKAFLQASPPEDEKKSEAA